MLWGKNIPQHSKFCEKKLDFESITIPLEYILSDFIRSKISTSNFSEIMPLEVYSIDAVSACEPVFRQGNLNISNTIRTPCKIIN